MDRFLRRGVVASIPCLLAACSSPLSTTEVLALGQAEARWASRPFQSYSYETITSCGECPRFIQQWVRVAVSNGQVVGAVFVANDSGLSATEQLSFTTIDGVFAQIGRYQHEDWVRDVKVTFDRQWGYPTSISTFAKDGIMDAGASRFIRSLVPKP